MAKKKYNPMKEIKKITATTVSVGVGTGVIGITGGMSPHTPSTLYTASGMMRHIPLVQTGGSLIRSLDMLNPPKRKKKKKRR